MTKPQRQKYGLGSFIKKFTKPIKKVVKSPLGKAALLGGLGWGVNKGMLPGGMGSGWMKRLLGSGIGQSLKKNLWSDRSFGEKSLLGLGILGVGTPYLQKLMKTGPYKEIVEEDEDWTIPSSSLANLLTRTKDYYRDYNPSLSNLSFQPPKWAVDETFYSAKGGLAKLANGGVAEAQAEQMLKMEYQKYRNQGGTMSYQQFKMAVLKQAQAQGPMAQGQQVPQMAAGGGRIGYADRGLVDYDLDKLRSNLPNLDEVEITNPDVSKDYSWLWDLVKARSQPPKKEWIKKKKKWSPSAKAEGGLMDMGGMEKDYRQEGGFVPIGGKEKADDVPARLSKNEFVFTADAVRAAGGGDIDAGAEVMENVMNNLEEGGEISEESQGAQGMYNNMKQLETRVA